MAATAGIPGIVGAVIMFLLVLILYGLSIASLLSITFYISKLGYDSLKKLLENTINPNKNYVDPVDGVTHKHGDGTIYPAAAVWPKRWYREEWDDMIKDPISDDVVKQRESLLPDILQGSINDKDNVTDAYKIAYMEIEPESLNWTQSLRNVGTYYNKFINRIGDDFMFTFIIAPLIIYTYLSKVSKYYPAEGEVFQWKDLIL